MVFRILDYLNNLEVVENNPRRSYIIAVCPICREDNLKINKKTGAYKCWANECETQNKEQFRKALGASIYGASSAIGPSQLFKPSPIIPKPTKFTGTHLVKLDYEPVIPQAYKSTQLVEGRKRTIFITTYSYSDDHKVVRIEGDTETGKKVVTPYYRDWEEGWVNAKTDSHDILKWPLYTEGLQDCVFNSNDCILMVEGEKTANFCKSNLKIFTITSAACAWSISEVAYALKYKLYPRFRGLSNILYVSDFDQPGIKKAAIIESACSMAGIGYLLLPIGNMGRYFNFDLSKGDDLVDLVPRLPSYQVAIDYMEQYIRTSTNDKIQ